MTRGAPIRTGFEVDVSSDEGAPASRCVIDRVAGSRISH
jgi:hypothetical protein